MPLAPTPLMLVKRPQQYSLPSPPKARARTSATLAPLVAPLPKPDQLAPSHLARPRTTVVPALVNVPPAYTSLPLMAMASTVPFRPLAEPVPREAQPPPSQTAIRLAVRPLALVK